MTIRWVGATAGMALLLAAATTSMGCVPSDGSLTQDSQETTSPAPDDVPAAFSGLGFDYEPYESPAEMARGRALVVEATIEGVSPGRTTVVTGTDTVIDTSIVVALADTTFLTEQANPGGDGRIYLELPNPGSNDPSDYGQAFPAGARVVAYLDHGWDGKPAGDVELADPDAGRPQGQSIYMVPGPQALIVEARGGELVWPLLGETREASLSDVEPEGGVIGGVSE